MWLRGPATNIICSFGGRQRELVNACFRLAALDDFRNWLQLGPGGVPPATPVKAFERDE